MSDFERVGESLLRAAIDEFVDRCFDDVMIGYLFRHANRDRVKRFEYQHAAEHLGAALSYQGRSIRAAHKKHVILTGHFGRRLVLLRESLERHHLPEDIVERWISYHQSLRNEVLTHPDSECGPPTSS